LLLAGVFGLLGELVHVLGGGVAVLLGDFLDVVLFPRRFFRFVDLLHHVWEKIVEGAIGRVAGLGILGEGPDTRKLVENLPLLLRAGALGFLGELVHIVRRGTPVFLGGLFLVLRFAVFLGVGILRRLLFGIGTTARHLADEFVMGLIGGFTSLCVLSEVTHIVELLDGFSL